MRTRKPITLVSERLLVLPTVGDKVPVWGRCSPSGMLVAPLEGHALFFFFFNVWFHLSAAASSDSET